MAMITSGNQISSRAARRAMCSGLCVWRRRPRSLERHAPVDDLDSLPTQEVGLFALVAGNQASAAGHHSPPWQIHAPTGQNVANCAGRSGISCFSRHLTACHDGFARERFKYFPYSSTKRLGWSDGSQLFGCASTLT
jgi:hypothetical protein